MIIDKLFASVKEKGHVCVGIDTSIDYIPESFKAKFQYEEDALFRFNQKIIDATFENAACFKVQIAYYEALGMKGLRAYKKTLQYIRGKGGIIIADIKRGDIANTAKMYAKAHFEGDFESDFITLNPYMGKDSLMPYYDYFKNKEKGAFALVRTSNKGAEDIQYIKDREDKTIYENVGEMISGEGEQFLGSCSYSSLGAVLGCTHREEAAVLRNKFVNTFFLIPGYGAQGGTAEDVALYLKDGNGGVVNSSRGILLAYKNYEDGEKNFDLYAEKETVNMKNSILQALGGV